MFILAQGLQPFCHLEDSQLDKLGSSRCEVFPSSSFDCDAYYKRIAEIVPSQGMNTL